MAQCKQSAAKVPQHILNKAATARPSQRSRARPGWKARFRTNTKATQPSAVQLDSGSDENTSRREENEGKGADSAQALLKAASIANAPAGGRRHHEAQRAEEGNKKTQHAPSPRITPLAPTTTALKNRKKCLRSRGAPRNEPKAPANLIHARAKNRPPSVNYAENSASGRSYAKFCTLWANGATLCVTSSAGRTALHTYNPC